ncbi:hypothetical protein F4818DRAFT_435388 [Hypoxylon cercidicola]|nr:hypothetical protein F4818DRAFT_435388 [Hypoxylon cercidicola]
MSRFNFKTQPAYQEYSAWETRPDGLPVYELDEDGEPIVAPGELFCRARIEDGVICYNATKQYQPSNLRNHLKTTHGYTIAKLPPGPLNAVDHHKTNKFYTDLVARAAGNRHDDDDDEPDGEDITPLPNTPIKTSRRRTGSTPNPGSGSQSSPPKERHDAPRKKDGKPDGRTMRKMVGYTGRACDACVVLGRKASGMYSCSFSQLYTN